MPWDSKQYLKFANERKQPCIDLISRLNGDFNSILDLGCGPGNSTENLFKKYTKATVTGFDADDNMLKRAKEDHPDIQFVKGFAPNDFDKLNQKFDLVFSNACIQWISGQEKLIEGVCEILNKGGTFAVQVPKTASSLFYKILHRLIEQKWTKLKSVRTFYTLNAEGYYNALIKRFKDVTVWQSDYYHVVSKESVIEWFMGSGLRPYLELLDAGEEKEFLNDLYTEINKGYRLLDDGNVFLIMPRLFFIAKDKL